MTNKKYHNLILNVGAYEGAGLSSLILGTRVGYDTPKEILTAFREALLAVVKEKLEEDAAGQCSNCETKLRTPLEQYCSFCGRHLKLKRNLDLEAAAFFERMFQTQLHEFVEWDTFVDHEWYVGCFFNGRYVIQESFEQMLAAWDEVDFSNTEIQSLGLISPDKEIW